MAVGITLLIILVLSIAIWVIIEIKRLKHKLFAIFLIGLLLFAYFGSVMAFKGKDVDYKTVPGLIDATKIYFSWLGFIFTNMKTLTAGAVQMDWESNETIKS
ncbi:hypothetical protein CMI39_03735 [Candidatus Pacearchaeota archaeon]|jgi:hypothetical protein|nr:hypothetical protein [Candidatus Pacearchaeota archaeon]|tara:strand:+ start:10032 stop:10337 length:306 start_codon:yes stop_codon:yes gene_type:complete